MQAQLNIPFAQYTTEHAISISMCMLSCTACTQHAQHKDKKSIALKYFARAPLEKTLKCWEAKPAWKYQEPLLTYQGPRGTFISWLYWTCTHRFGSFFSRAVCRSRLGKDAPISVCSCSCIDCLRAWPDPTRDHCTCVYCTSQCTYIVYTCVIEQRVKSKSPTFSTLATILWLQPG